MRVTKSIIVTTVLAREGARPHARPHLLHQQALW
jgi:hypothetical protein